MNPREYGPSNFQRGIASLMILSLLKREDMYGYQLVLESERISGGRILTQEGSLYPILYKLIEQGCITDRREQVGQRMRRVYYHLEPAGETKLQELIQDYTSMVDAMFHIIGDELLQQYGYTAP